MESSFKIPFRNARILTLLLFLCIQLTLADVAMVYKYVDPQTPELRIYPKNPAFTPGLFNLVGFTVAHNQTHAFFDVEFASVTNPWGSPYGFSHQICQIFIDSDRKPRSGSLDPRGLGVDSYGYLQSIYPYEVYIFLMGWRAQIYYINIDPEKPDELTPTTSENTIRMILPTSKLGLPSLNWAYTLWCGSNNQERFREVKAQAQEWVFGGGHDVLEDPQFVDMAVPEGVNKTEILSEYLYGRKAIVPAVGNNIFFERNVTELKDGLSDTRSFVNLYDQIQRSLEIGEFHFSLSSREAVFYIYTPLLREDAQFSSGFAQAVFQIYVDMDGKFRSGYFEGISGADFSTGNRGWELAVTVSPNSASVATFNASSKSLDFSSQAHTRFGNGVLEVRVATKVWTTLNGASEAPANWSFIVLSGLASGDQLSPISCQTEPRACLGKSYDSIPLNIVDIVNPLSTSTSEFLQDRDSLNGKVLIPFLTSKQTYLKRIFTLSDQLNDENVEYPTNSQFNAWRTSKGIFDIDFFEIAQSSTDLVVSILMNNPAGLKVAQAYSFLRLLVCVDTDQIYGSGLNKEPFGVNISPHPADSWDFCMSLNPQAREWTFLSDEGPNESKRPLIIDGNYIQMSVPATFFGNTQYDKWGYFVSSFGQDHLIPMAISQQPSQSAFGRQCTESCPNVIDVISGPDLREYLTSWDSIPAWSRFPDTIRPSRPTPEIVFWAKDFVGDQFGIYPSSVGFQENKNVFDIVEFSVRKTSTEFLFDVKFKDLGVKLPLYPKGMLDYLGLHIYMDANRAAGEGLTTGLPSTNIAMETSYAWDYVVKMVGERVSLIHFNGTVLASNSLVALNNATSFRFPVHHFPADYQSFLYVVCSGLIVDTQTGLFVEREELPQPFAFGGGHNSNFDPSIVDYVGESPDQSVILGSYEPNMKKFVTIPAIGPNVVSGRLLWQTTDSRGDAESNSADLVRFTVGSSGSWVWMRFEFSTNEQLSNPRQVFEKTLLHIYIDQDPSKALGNTNTIGNIPLILESRYGWELSIVLDVHRARFRKLQSNPNLSQDISVPHNILFEKNRISLQFDATSLPMIDLSAGFVVISGTKIQAADVQLPEYVPASILDYLSIDGAKSGTSARETIVPYVGGFRTNVFFSVNDTIGDEFGPYPTALASRQSRDNPPSVDLADFRILTSMVANTFVFEFSQPLTNPLGLLNGFSHPIISLYMHSGGRDGGTSLVDNSGVSLQAPWIASVVFHGAGAKMHIANSSSIYDMTAYYPNPIKVELSLDRKSIQLQTARGLLGDIPPEWSYTVLVGLHSKVTGQYRIRNQVASEENLGGGDDGAFDPNVVDVLIPAIIPQSLDGKVDPNQRAQSLILNSYSVELKRLAVIPRAGPTVAYNYEEWLALEPSAQTTIQETSEAKDISVVIIATIVPVFVLIVAIAIYFWRKKSTLYMQPWMVAMKDVSMKSIIGSGSFGDVFLAEWRSTTVAVKVLRDIHIKAEGLIQFRNEFKLMCELRHPSLCMFMGGSLQHPHFFIIVEYMDYGSLFDLLHDEIVEFSDATKFSFIRDAIDGMSFLHSHEPPIIHGDLKSLNLLVDKNLKLKVTDFGLSQTLGSKGASDHIGTVMWTAPEILEQQPSTAKSDVFSFGIILWELFSGEELYKDMPVMVVALNVMQGMRPNKSKAFLDAGIISDLAIRCWDKDADKRPTFAELRKEIAPLSTNSAITTSRTSKLGSLPGKPVFDRLEDMQGDIICAFEIAESNIIWENHPLPMHQAMEEYMKLTHQMIIKHGGSVLRISTDHHVVKFSKYLRAVQFSCELQERLMEVTWPEQLLKDCLQCAPVLDKSHKIILQGFRVAMVVVQTESKTRGEDSGSQTNMGTGALEQANKLLKFAQGGTILCNPADLEMLDHSDEKSKLYIHEASYVDDDGVQHKAVVVVPRMLRARLSDSTFDGLRTQQPGIVEGNNTSLLESRAKLPTEVTFHVEYDEITLGKLLGQGSYGEVFLGRLHNQDVAVKKFTRQAMSSRVILDFRKESMLMRKFDHPNILKLVGVCVERPNLCIIMELASFGSVQSMFTDERVQWNSDTITRLLKGTAEGMNYLHRMEDPVIHRDLKCANILVNDRMEAKIADFGLSRVKDTHKTMTRCGTAAWTAPEILKGKKYDEKVDVYSFGIVMWEMVTRQVPYGDVRKPPVEIMTCIVRQSLRPPTKEYRFANEYKQLMERCWNENPEMRPSFLSIIQQIESPNFTA